MENLLAVCITHVDQVEWDPQVCLRHVDEEFGFRAVIFSSPDKSQNDLIQNILELCMQFHDINVNERNFFKMFKVGNNNLKILKTIKREVDKLRQIHQDYLAFKGNFEGQEKIDLSFEYQAYFEELVQYTLRSVSLELEFTFMDLGSRVNEMAHYSNLANQLRSILFAVRLENLNTQSGHGVGGKL